MLRRCIPHRGRHIINPYQWARMYNLPQSEVKVKSLSCVWLFVTPWTAAYQAPPSMGFSRQEYWSGEPSPHMLLLLLRRFSRVRLCNPTDGSPPGSIVPGILQATTLEWATISFSNAWKWKVKAKSLSKCPILCDPMDCSLPGSFIHGIFQARVLEWVAIAFSS